MSDNNTLLVFIDLFDKQGRRDGGILLEIVDKMCLIVVAKINDYIHHTGGFQIAQSRLHPDNIRVFFQRDAVILTKDVVDILLGIAHGAGDICNALDAGCLRDHFGCAGSDDGQREKLLIVKKALRGVEHLREVGTLTQMLLQQRNVQKFGERNATVDKILNIMAEKTEADVGAELHAKATLVAADHRLSALQEATAGITAAGVVFPSKLKVDVAVGNSNNVNLAGVFNQIKLFKDRVSGQKFLITDETIIDIKCAKAHGVHPPF